MTKAFVVKAVLVFGSVLLSLGLLEAACRLLLGQPGYIPRGSFDPPGLWTVHDERGYTYAPRFRGSVQRESLYIDISTSTLGFRTSPLAVQADVPARVPVLAVGASFTFGWGVNYEQAWPGQLDHLLERRGIAAAHAVFNAGVSGYSTRQIRLLTEELVRLFHPKVVIAGVYPIVIGRIQDPYVLYNGGIAQQSSLPRLRAAAGGWLYAPMYQPWLRALDFWLDENWWSAAYALKSLYSVRNLLTEENAGPQAASGSGERRSL